MRRPNYNPLAAMAKGSALATIVVVAYLAMVSASGCKTLETVPRAELSAQREAMNQATQSIRDEHLEWTHALSSPAGRDALPLLTPEQVQRRELAHAEYNALVQRRRDADAKVNAAKAATTRPAAAGSQ